MFNRQASYIERACKIIVNLPKEASWTFTITNEDGEGENPTTPSLDIGISSGKVAHEVRDRITSDPWEVYSGHPDWMTVVHYGIEITVMGPEAADPNQIDLFPDDAPFLASDGSDMVGD